MPLPVQQISPVPSRLRRLAAPTLVALAAAIGACAEVGTDPSEPFSIQFSALPSPSILVGDTLRDLEGNPVDLRDSVRVYNAENELLADFPVRFLATNDSARLRWDEGTGFLVSIDTTSRTTVGIQASAGSLVPAPVTLAIVRAAPDSAADPDTGFARLIFATSAPSTVTQRALQARLLDDTAAAVSNWPVQFRIVTPSALLDSVRFIASATDTLRSSPWDTTTSGTASRFVRAWAKASAAEDAEDTLVVEAVFRVRDAIAGRVEYKVPVIVNRVTP